MGHGHTQQTYRSPHRTVHMLDSIQIDSVIPERDDADKIKIDDIMLDIPYILFTNIQMMSDYTSVWPTGHFDMLHAYLCFKF